MATLDAMTGLMNHAAILNELNKEITRSKRLENDLSVILADLDHFKKINDTYGHQVGDQVLCHVARIIKEIARPYDHVGRYGGEEFLFVIPECSKDDAMNYAERIRKKIETTPLSAGDTKIEFTISLGVSGHLCSDVEDCCNLIVTEADQALYQAKSDGRNLVRAYTHLETV